MKFYITISTISVLLWFKFLIKEKRTVFNLLKLKRKNATVGVDIHHSGVNVIQVSFHQGLPCIDGFAKEVLPLGALEEGTIKNSQLVSECIKRALDKGNIQAKKAVIAVPDAAVITKFISVNADFSLKEIEEFIDIESDDLVSYSRNDVHIDFQVTGSSATNAAMQEVQVFISRAEKVNERVSVVNQAGLDVKIVDIESYAMQRSAQLFVKELVLGGAADDRSGELVAMIDIGWQEIRLFIFLGMDVIFTREEELDHESPIAAPAPYYSGEQAYHSLVRGDELSGLQTLMEVLLSPIQRLLQFFFSRSQYQRIDGIILAGEMARVPGLWLFLQKEMGVVTRVANPLSYLKVSQTIDYQAMIDASPSMMLACGLALRQF